MSFAGLSSFVAEQLLLRGEALLLHLGSPLLLVFIAINFA